MKQLRRKDAGRDAHTERDHEAEHDGLHAGDGSVFGILLADAARHHGSGGKREAEADGKDQRQQRLGEADGGDSVGAEATYPEHIDNGKERFEHHLEHHGNGEQEDGAVEATGGVVLVRAAEGFTDSSELRTRDHKLCARPSAGCGVVVSRTDMGKLHMPRGCAGTKLWVTLRSI